MVDSRDARVTAVELRLYFRHYNDVTMDTMASQIVSLAIVYSTVYSGIDQRKHQSSASLASVRGIHRWPVNSPHKWPVTRKMFPFDDVIMFLLPRYINIALLGFQTKYIIYEYKQMYQLAYNLVLSTSSILWWSHEVWISFLDHGPLAR